MNMTLAVKPAWANDPTSDGWDMETYILTTETFGDNPCLTTKRQIGQNPFGNYYNRHINTTLTFEK